MRGVLDQALVDAETLLRQFRTDQKNLDVLERVCRVLYQTFKDGHKVLICGNGGSMADAMHFAEEWTGRFRQDRQPYPAIALGADPSHLTCVSNDYGFEHVFSRLVEALGASGDVLILLTTSGNSQNLLRAAEAGRAKGLTTVAFVGKGGGNLAGLGEHVLFVPGETSDRIQEIQMLCLHAMIEAVEAELGR